MARLCGTRSKREFTGPSSTLCMCACIALSHPRCSFEASQLEGNNLQRRQRHLWRLRNNSMPNVNLEEALAVTTSPLAPIPVEPPSDVKPPADDPSCSSGSGTLNTAW